MANQAKRASQLLLERQGDIGRNQWRGHNYGRRFLCSFASRPSESRTTRSFNGASLGLLRHRLSRVATTIGEPSAATPSPATASEDARYTRPNARSKKLHHYQHHHHRVGVHDRLYQRWYTAEFRAVPPASSKTTSKSQALRIFPPHPRASAHSKGAGNSLP